MKKIAFIPLGFILISCNYGGLGTDATLSTKQEVNHTSIDSNNEYTDYKYEAHYYVSLASMPNLRNPSLEDFAIVGNDTSVYVNSNAVNNGYQAIRWQKITLPNLFDEDKHKTFFQIKSCGTEGENPFFVAVGSGGLVYTGLGNSSTLWSRVAVPQDINFTSVACSQDSGAEVKVMLAGFKFDEKNPDNHYNDRLIVYGGKRVGSSELQVSPIRSPDSIIRQGWHFDDVAYGNGKFVFIANPVSSDFVNSIILSTMDMGNSWQINFNFTNVKTHSIAYIPSPKLLNSEEGFTLGGFQSEVTLPGLVDSSTRISQTLASESSGAISNSFIIGTSIGYSILDDKATPTIRNYVISKYNMLNSELGSYSIACNSYSCLLAFFAYKEPNNSNSSFSKTMFVRLFDNGFIHYNIPDFNSFTASTYSKHLDAYYILRGNQIFSSINNGIPNSFRVVTSEIEPNNSL